MRRWGPPVGPRSQFRSREAGAVGANTGCAISGTCCAGGSSVDDTTQWVRRMQLRGQRRPVPQCGSVEPQRAPPVPGSCVPVRRQPVAGDREARRNTRRLASPHPRRTYASADGVSRTPRPLALTATRRSLAPPAL